MMDHEDCKLHGPMQNAILNTEIQYGKINEKLEIIEKSIAAINTKFAVLESHKVVEKLEKINLDDKPSEAVAVSQGNNWFKVAMGLIGIITMLAGVLVGKGI